MNHTYISFINRSVRKLSSFIMKKKRIKQKIKRILNLINLLKKLQLFLKRKEKLQMEILARRIAREEGLNKYWENILIAVLKCESGLNPKAVNKNKDGTYDYGIAQFNSYWYVKKGLITKEDCFKPEKAIRLMCQRFKKGRARDWVCYKTGKYQEFL